MDILIGALIGLAAAYFVIRATGKKDKRGTVLHQNRIGDGLKRLNENKKKYAVMTEALLSTTEDDALLEAVLSNLWAKMADDLSDAAPVMRGETTGRRYVFAIYAVTGGVGQTGFKRLKECADAAFLPVCADALEAIGAGNSASILREAIESDDADKYKDAYLESFSAEDGKERMAAYIRANTEAFLDQK